MRIDIAQVQMPLAFAPREFLPAPDARDATSGNQNRAVLNRRPGDRQDDAGAQEKLMA